MQPAFDPRPWGTLDLSPIYPNHRFEEKIGEAWLTGDACKVANGPLEREVARGAELEVWPRAGGRGACRSQPLSLASEISFSRTKNFPCRCIRMTQAARRVGQPWGKTECWYVAHAKPGAQIALGLKPGVTRDNSSGRSRETRRRTAELDQCLSGRNDLRGRRHGAHAGAGSDHRRNPAAVGHDVSPLRLRTSARIASERRPGRGEGESGSGKVVRPAPSKFEWRREIDARR